MKTEILISVDEWENRVAVLEEGSLAEIYFEREEKVIGSIYKGRVENVLPGMGACFVNIGLGRNAFLYVDDILRDPINIGETEITDRRKGHTVSELLKVGSDVLVQIVKEPRGLKGARVSTNISLPGRYLVLMPTGRYSGVSSKIEDANERARLKQILRRVRPEGMATIVRTAAQGVSEAELIADLGVQLRLWHGILESYKRSTAPALLHKDLNLVFKAVRDFLTSDVSAVYIDSKEQYEEIRSTMSLLGPQFIDRLKLVDGQGTLFAQRGIDEELQKLLKPKIPLPSGGHLVLEHTEALTVIDVNTGKFTGGRNLEDTIVKTNVEAAAEIARQVRLRDIGGIIVVDFIDMAHERSREQVIATLTESLRRDRTRSTIQMFSKLGLLEFTRKRVGKDLSGQLRSDCPYCAGLGNVMSSETIAIGVLRRIRASIGGNGQRAKRLDVVTDPAVATQLLGWYHDELTKLLHDHDIEVSLFVEPQRHREQVAVESARRLRAAPPVGATIEAELMHVRMPNPASGVAVINGYLVEVRDGANGAGQTVKIKVEGVEDNLVQAQLAEPLQMGLRRRKRERARKTAASEAPTPPPAPALPARGIEEESVAAADKRAEARPKAGRHRRPISPVAFSIEDEADDEMPATQTFTARGRRAAAPSRPERGRRDKREYEEEPSRSRGRHRPSKARSEEQQYPPSLVVGGEGDIDYEDADEDMPATKGPRREPERARSDEQVAASGGRRRRRRRGRGKSRIGQTSAQAASSALGDEDEIDREEPVFVTRRASEPPAKRTAASGRYPRRDEDDESDADELDAVVQPRRLDGGPRSAKTYGPVRQLYGKPVQRGEQRPRPQSAQRSSAARKRPDADELEIVVKPKGPAAIRVEAQPDMLHRRPSGGREPRDGARAPSRFGGRERDRGRSSGRQPRREGPAVKQLYPPPDQEQEAMDESERGRAHPPSPKTRGPLMRPSDAPPVPKGKVRQLYPPPEDIVTVPEDRSSLFISDAAELDERRLRARERAEARRRSETESDQTAGSAQEAKPAEPVMDEPTETGTAPRSYESSESDEWPAY